MVCSRLCSAMCSLKVAKIILVSINIFFFFVGAIILTLGILAQWFQDVLLRLFSAVPDDIMDDISKGWDIPELLGEAASLLIVVGIIIFPIGFFGCWGALRENRCMLITYITVLSISLVFEIAIIIVVAVATQGAEDKVIQSLQRSIQRSYFDSNGGLKFDVNGYFQFAVRPVKLAWDGVQVVMECCGAVNASDYINANFQGEYNFTTNGTMIEIKDAQVPLSCCNFLSSEDYEKEREDFTQSPFELNTPSKVDSFTQCLNDVTPEYTHQRGCYHTVLEIIWEYWVFFLSFISCTILCEVLVLVYASNVLVKTKYDKFSQVPSYGTEGKHC